MPSRSLCVHPDWIETVNQAYEDAYVSSRCPNQKDFADRIPVSPTQVGLSIETLNKFRKGESVDREYFYALCDRLGLKAEQITVARLETEVLTEAPPTTVMDMAADESGGELATVPPVIDAEYADVEEPTTQAAVRPKDTIHQKIGTLKNLAAGDVGEYNRQPGSAPTSDEGEESSSLSDEEQPKDLDLRQEVDVVEETGILLGRVRRINDKR
jgi:hypothetical protein